MARGKANAKEAVKKVEGKVEAAAEKAKVKTAEVKKAATAKAAEKKAAVKATAKKASAKAAEKKEAVKATAKKASAKAAEKKAEVKTAAKKTSAKVAAKAKEAKAAVKKVVGTSVKHVFEVEGVQVTTDAIYDRIVEAYKAEGHRAGNIKSVEIYYNFAERKAYYVRNGKPEDKFVEF